MNIKSVPECARLTGVSCGRIRRAIRTGELHTLTIGTRECVDVDEVRALFDESRLTDIDTISELTGMRPSAIRRAVRDGWLPGVLIDRRLMFHADDVIKAIEDQMRRGRHDDTGATGTAGRGWRQREGNDM